MAAVPLRSVPQLLAAFLPYLSAVMLSARPGSALIIAHLLPA